MEKKHKQKITNKKGITLIALIITIIVLLILAGVSIMMLAGENGILNRAVDASEATKEANAKELVGLAVMESIDETGKFDVEKFQELIETQNGNVEEDGENLNIEMNGYEITVDEKSGKIGEVTKVEEKDIPEMETRAYGEIEVRFLSGSGNTVTETANKPILGTNMKAVNFNSSTNKWEEVDESNWNYSYNKEAGTSEWANAVVKDESGNITGYFVWIPRYAYKIRYYNDSEHTTLVGYSDSRGIVQRKDKAVLTGGSSNRINAGNNFIVHPCFTDDVNVGGWDKDLKGIWVAKYEASGTTSSLKVMPGVESLRQKNIGDMYTAARSYESTSLGSHLMKNSEWGAVAYLSYSKYGLGWKTPIANNADSDYYTGGSSTEATIYVANKAQSTTGNVYGVYDMNGGAKEYVASYVNNGCDSLTTYGGSFAKKDKTQAKSDKFVTVYKASNSEDGKTGTSDDRQLDYNLSGESMFGDATYETSASYSDSMGSWCGACADFPCGDIPFFYRGGNYNNSNAGIFFFDNDRGVSTSDFSFRPVLAF